MKIKKFENFANEEFDKEIDYYLIRQYIEDQYGISGVSDSDIDEWVEVLTKRGEDISQMSYIDIAESMYEDFEQRVEKDWEEDECNCSDPGCPCRGDKLGHDI